MALLINTNIQSLNAQRNLNKTLSPLQKAMQRLSSGLRINSAKDDAAGLSIATRMSSQIRGLNQAIRNSNDAISLVQTAEGAIDEITNALQRVRELAVQAANATNTAVDRGALDLEAQQLLAEVDRIAIQTQFNNQTLLDGTLGTKAYQVGAYAGQTISVSITTGLKVSQVGSVAEQTGSALAGNAIGDNEVYINDVEIAQSQAGSEAGQADTSAYAIAQAISTSGITGLTATALTGTKTSTTASVGVDFSAAAETYTLVINGVTIVDLTSTDATSEDLTQSELVDQINLYSPQTGVTATVNGSDIELTTADGRNIDLTGTDDSGIGGGSVAFDDATSVITYGSIKLSSSANIEVNDTNNRLGFGAGTTTISALGSLASADVLSVDNSNTTMQRIDSALSVVANLRAELGAINNRFESTISNLSNMVENVTAACSRIMDADFAAETANLTKAMILQQAGISVLAQANTLPQNVLALLQG